MTRGEQKSTERRVFGIFVEASGLDVVSESIELPDPPQPDVLCTLATGEPRAFELVQVVDPDLARGFGDLGPLERALETDLKAAGDHFADALIVASVHANDPTAQKHSAIRQLGETLCALPAGFSGEVPSHELPNGIGACAIVKPWDGGPFVSIDVGGATSDYVLPTIQAKFNKKYESAAPIVAYFSIQPHRSEGSWIEYIQRVVASNLGRSPFAGVWLLEAGQPKILLRVP